jgi:hypothetical protein
MLPTQSQLEKTEKMDQDSVEDSFKMPNDDDIILDSKKVTK